MTAKIKKVNARTGNAKDKKSLFGDPCLDAMYRRTKQYAGDSGIFRICRMEDPGEGFKRLIICNLWRIDRFPDGRVSLFTRDLRTDLWTEDRDLSEWPYVPLWPVKSTRSLVWWKDLVRKSLSKALDAAGYAEIDSDMSHPLNDRIPLVRDAVMRSYLPRRKQGSDISCEDRAFLDPKGCEAGARSLRAAFYEHIAEKDLLGAAWALNYRYGNLTSYLTLALRADEVRRIARESRNLLPLMASIRPEHWTRTDLFSRKIWVRDGRKTTMADRKAFSDKTCSFATPSGWRWIANAKMSVVAEWINGGVGPSRADTDIIEIFAHANIGATVPSHVWRHLLRFRRHFFRTPNNRDQIGRIFRAFVLESERIWKTQGFGALRTWIRNEMRLQNIADWFNGEGSESGLPNKNAGWRSIERAAHDWHERQAIQYVAARGEDVAWESLLGDMEIDGVTCSPLSSRHALLKEGYVQHHCIGSYDTRCMEGIYRVFSLEDREGNRSTLGIAFLVSPPRWIVNQHYGKYNGAISDEAKKAGEEISLRYTEFFLSEQHRKRKRRDRGPTVRN